MPITQPTNDTPFPEDLKKHYDDAKNAITLAEAEVARLRDLRISEEVTIVELNKQIAWANEQAVKATDNLTKLQKELVSLVTQSGEIASQIIFLKTEKEELAKSLTERENACVAQEIHLADRELALALRTATLEERTVLIENRESEVKERENNIKNFVATL